MKADLEVYFNRYFTGIQIQGPRQDLNKIRGIHLDPFKPRQNKGVMPLTPLSLQILQEAFPHTVPTIRLARWLTDEKRRRELQLAQYSLSDPISKRLYDFQNKGVTYLRSSRYWNDGQIRAVIADDPRLGKTVQTLFAVGHDRNTPMLVVTMKPLILYWADAIRQWGQFSQDAIPLTKGSITSRVDRLSKAKIGDVFVVNWEVLRKMSKFPPRKFNTIIADEAHVVRNRKSQVTKGLLHMRPENILLASATPLERGPQDYWTYMNAIRPYEFRSYWRWVDWFCATQYNGFGTTISGVRNVDLLKDLMTPIMLRRQASQVANVPEKIYETIRIEPTPRLMGLYDQIYKEVEVEFEDFSIEIPNKLAMLTRLRQLSVDPQMIGAPVRSPKKGVIGALAQKYGDQQMVVYCSFRSGIRFIAEELKSVGVTCVQYKGEENLERMFLTGQVQVLISHPQVGGVGKDYSNANILVYYDLPLSATLLRQSIERTTKIGITTPRLIITIVSTPIEETVSNLIATKLKTINDVDIHTSILLAHKKSVPG